MSCVTGCRIADVRNIGVRSHAMRGLVRSVRSRRTSFVSVGRRKSASSVAGKGRMRSSAAFGRVERKGRGARGLAVEESAVGSTTVGSMNVTRYVVSFRPSYPSLTSASDMSSSPHRSATLSAIPRIRYTLSMHPDPARRLCRPSPTKMHRSHPDLRQALSSSPIRM